MTSESLQYMAVIFLLLASPGIESVDACALYCLDGVAYTTCPSSPNQHLPAQCNCCGLTSGCQLHRSDGTVAVNC
ncbi:hypothetical protein GOP47_0005932 [Adiantum capillus-veneris]|uniref:Uncharacterized protein n=1 Tax=Adiantum capillus-veneris TaxID=13818 RepID=A0A9D4V2L3_ADICA|nr:hypothetical protein GOP47_0005932 [Adiantum capillus-veneris]